MKHYETQVVSQNRVEFHMATPADWIDVEKMYHHALQRAERDLGSGGAIGDDTVKVRVGDDVVVVYYVFEEVVK